MLVQIDFKDELNEEYADRGVTFSTEASDEEGIKRVFKGMINPEHEFWKKHYPDGAKASRIFYALEDNRLGVYWGWNLDNNIKDYFNYNLESRFSQFDKSTGQFYSKTEMNEVYDHLHDDYQHLSTGKAFPQFSNLIGSYGVSDNVEQVLERYKAVVDNPDVQIIISFAPVNKEDQPKNGGWRWHKWGEYIGTHEPKHDYHDDEDRIEAV